jgi:solute carrier family 25 carnitine/acylcarnitine transporter 20/29
MQFLAIFLNLTPSRYVEYGPPTAVGILGIILICLFFYGVRAFWRRDLEATYEPMGGFGQADDDE